MLALGALIMLTVLTQIEIFGREWDVHTMIAGSLLAIVGTQVVGLGLCAHAYGTYYLGEKDPWFDRMRARFRLEHGLLLGGAIALVGFVVAAVVVGIWIDRGLRRAERGAARDPGRDAHRRRHPDLLLVVPALDHRPAPLGSPGAAAA